MPTALLPHIEQQTTEAAGGCQRTLQDHVGAHLAVDDIKVLVAEVLEDFVDVLFFIEQGQRMQQVAPADATHISAIFHAAQFAWTCHHACLFGKHRNEVL